MSLSPSDRSRIEAQPFDPLATIAYHVLAGCLVWSDEIPEGLSPDGYDYVRDLLGARGYLHRGVPFETWPSGSTSLAERWTEALGDGLRWNGFRRRTLTAEQQALLAAYLADDSDL